MTVPRFRAWDTFHKKWVKHFYITENGLIYDMGRQHRNLIGAVPIEKSGLIVMQSTGLFDSSLEPVEIYKDDIVAKSLPNGAVLVGVVTFTKGMFLVDGVEAIDQSWVVIGNIHEHPHLLEGLND
ncbi:YopX family protein [Streptococcus pluranimalium]|uniref:YopX family protein n=1 Tax=Streptococcus pluranimalium TaxID=82348 RepID=UPI002A78C698|nr:YopX family protein [Streptococcus pluranimalium]